MVSHWSVAGSITLTLNSSPQYPAMLTYAFAIIIGVVEVVTIVMCDIW